jgi:hypothetical protein
MIHHRFPSTIACATFAACGTTLTLAALALGSIACSRDAAPPPAQQTAASPAQEHTIPATERPPSGLAEIGESAKLLFDAAYALDWGAAADRIQALNESASALPATLPKPDLVAQLRSRLDAVRQTVSMHQRIETMDDANGMTRLVADLAAEFQTQVPYEVVMLGYYGRQLELGIASARPSTLTQASTDLRSTWNRIEPAIERRGHIDDARRFTDIVVQLEGARRPADFVAPTRAELSEADRIEKLFRSPT